MIIDGSKKNMVEIKKYEYFNIPRHKQIMH
jgi:hypothetical protein